MSRALHASALAMLVMVGAATSVAAQTVESAGPANERSRQTDLTAWTAEVLDRLPSDKTSASGLTGPAIQLRAESDSSEAAVVLGASQDFLVFNSWSVRFATPIDKGESSANFLTDDGLTGASSVRVVFSRVSELPGFVVSADEQTALATRAIAICESSARTEEARSACKGHHYRVLANHLQGDDQRKLKGTTLDDANIWLWTVALDVGHEEITWRDPLSLAEQDTQRTPYAVSLTAGGSPGGERWRAFYVGGGLKVEREYPAGTARTLCSPPPPTGPQECFTGRFGTPQPSDTQVVHLVGRYQSTALPVAVELQPAYDVENDVAELAATLYFVPDATASLRGGLRFRWRTEDDDPLTDDDRFSFGVFVGAPFSLLAMGSD